MPRQIIVLCDGTNNSLSGWRQDTHVVLLAELLHRHPDPRRLVYYDPGVGNPGQLPGTTVVDKWRRFTQRVDGLAFGRGVFDNVAEGYRFLMQNWQPGDEIWLFGFSRGAFTARSIGGLVNAFGIIDAHQDTLVPSLVATYFSNASPSQQAIRSQVERLFGQADGGPGRPVLHFVGVWDTVASVGLPPFNLRIRARPDLSGKWFRHVRQALALDEQRAQFKPRAYAQDDGLFLLRDGSDGSVLQRWFRGSHCDVGGGNPYPQSEMARTPFAWMIAEAVRCGLRLPGAVPTLDTEAGVHAALAAVDPPEPRRGPPRIHSQTWATPLWALTGLAVRDGAHAAIDQEPDAPVRMAAHDSVWNWHHVFPAGTVWRERWPASRWLGLAAALLLVLGLLPAPGQLLAGGSGWPGWAEALDYLRADAAFQAWQLALAMPTPAWGRRLAGFDAPWAALCWDFALIAGYAFLLSHAVAPAFARLAGLVAPGQRAPRVLNLLGWALPLAVGADIAENLLTALAMLALRFDDDLLVWLPRSALFVASLAKWVGLAGTLALIIAGALRWPLRRAGPRDATPP